jgi:hypothetical protein
VLSMNLTPYCHVSLSYIMDFVIEISHQGIQTTRSHASRCHHYNDYHYCNVDFVVFHNVTCYTNSLSLRIHAKTTELLNIMCTLVATRVRLRSFQVHRAPKHNFNYWAQCYNKGQLRVKYRIMALSNSSSRGKACNVLCNFIQNIC